MYLEKSRTMPNSCVRTLPISIPVSQDLSIMAILPVQYEHHSSPKEFIVQHESVKVTHWYTRVTACGHRATSMLLITSGDENHLCRASLRESHKISLKAYRHAHGVGTLSRFPRVVQYVKHFMALGATVGNRTHPFDYFQSSSSILTVVCPRQPQPAATVNLVLR